MTKLVVGCPVWELDWSLDLWFQSVADNVDPKQTGLIFVVPPTETPARGIIDQWAHNFAFVEVMRDRQQVLNKTPDAEHLHLAHARNQILQQLRGINPDFYLAWDPNLLLTRGTVERLFEGDHDACTVWTWLNRHEPIEMEHNGQPVLLQRPVQATAMKWQAESRPLHYPSEEFEKRAEGWWRCDVINSFLMLSREAYPAVRYEPHAAGDVVPVCWQLQNRGIDRWCYGDRTGVYLPEYRSAEIALGWPRIGMYAAQMPLQATREAPDEPELAELGLYPIEKEPLA